MNQPQNESSAAPAPGIDSTSSASSPAPVPTIAAAAASSAPPSLSASASEGALLTPEQLALRLNVSRRCLGNWTRDRLIPMIKIGRVCRFDLPQVLAALERHVQGIPTR